MAAAAAQLQLAASVFFCALLLDTLRNCHAVMQELSFSALCCVSISSSHTTQVTALAGSHRYRLALVEAPAAACATCAIVCQATTVTAVMATAIVVALPRALQQLKGMSNQGLRSCLDDTAVHSHTQNHVTKVEMSKLLTTPRCLLPFDLQAAHVGICNRFGGNTVMKASLAMHPQTVVSSV